MRCKMINREYRCSECLELQDKEMESPYVCEGCEEKLEIKHIAPYLPYGLKCRLGDSIEEIKGINYLLGVCCVGFKGGGQMWDELTSIKPLLKPLSELVNDEIYDEISSLFLALYLGTPEMVKGQNPLNHISYGNMQLLLERHYDIFGLIDNGLAEVKG